MLPYMPVASALWLAAAPRDTVEAVMTLAVLLGVVLLVAVVTKYVHLPYTVALVIAGLVIAATGVPFAVPLTEDLILTVFLPALLFEAAYNLPWARLRAELRTINTLAIPGVFVSTAIVAGVVHLAGLPLPAAVLFGALISATDPVSVIATFRQLGTDRRLSIIVEGESLFNDGTALVIFRLVLGVVVGGAVSVVGTAAAFVVSIVGGIALGLAVGYLVAQLTKRIDDYLVEFSGTLLVTYTLFILAEELHIEALGVSLGASPVIAVVAYGLVTGNYASREAMSPATRIAMHETWELVGFLANSFIFLLIGLQVPLAAFRPGDIPLILAAIAGVLAGRAVIVYGFTALVNLRTAPGRRVPLRFMHVINWGGLRGAVALAAALSIPTAVAERGTLLLLTFAVVLFSLLVQGLTIRPLVAWVGLKPMQSVHLLAFERLQGQIVAVQAARRSLRGMLDTGEVGQGVYDQLADAYSQRAETLATDLAGLNVTADELREEQTRVAQRKALQAEKAALLSLRTRGVITDSVYRTLIADADLRLLALETPGEGQSATEIIAPAMYDERTTDTDADRIAVPHLLPDAGEVPTTVLETEAAPLVPDEAMRNT